MADRSDLSPGEQLVAQGSLVMRFENEQMSAIAVARPRDEAKVKERALAILEADHDAAAAAYYSIPYKKHTRSGDCTGLATDGCPVEQEVEGIGIDGARELARLWGNNASRVYFTEEDADWIRLSGVFVDLETNTRAEVPYAVSKIAVGRGGDVYTLNPQRLAMAIQAGVSKVARNAIVQGLPRHLSRAYYLKAKAVLGAKGAIDIPKLVESFSSYGVTREQLEAFYGGRLEDLDPEKRRNLRGLYVALREQLVTPAEFFAGPGTGGTERAGAQGVEGAPIEGATSSVSGSSATVIGGTQAKASPSAGREPSPETSSETPPADDAPSHPTPERVSSEEPTTEPSQVPFEDLGI